ncbi:MAG: sigma-54-dependent Fis family transcriptional regulator [Acidobacteriaceae bacterium]|nr:sigma-54-dependent Fis family transcriptional regulator [Acidobacteriaceae bacterium]MBV9224863.1 sigma-54-dependent Fis family transcriptional regulator [Acidobacteriaceae bacterium]MBV9307509.1 sigma-54-dependent Fis family transcriptional regulator [Acidobacteriaceae bacterium]
MAARGPKILIVDDEASIRQSLQGVLIDENYDCTAVGSGEACLKELAQGAYEAVLLDIWMPGIDGLTTLAKIQEIPAESRPAVIMISGHGNIETAVKATKLGAFDFVEKPLTIAKVSIVLNNAIKQRRSDQEVQRLREAAGHSEIIGDSVPMKALRQQLKLMAGTNGRVLIYGESGTGKELVARAIHQASQRAKGPFVEVNCAALPEDLIESELFGHRRYNLDGTPDQKIGKLQKAHSGTFFLDEVGDMSLRTQAKVLRALDEHRFEPVGAPQSVQVDARVIAATNKNLEKEIERGNFREDLFYRLNVIPFTVPPLRERKEDIPVLTAHFLREFTTAYGRKPKELSEEATAALIGYHWPGNVRELRNVMERIVILYPQRRIEARHLSLDSGRKAQNGRFSDGLGSLQEVKETAERDYILRKLEETGGNVSRTSELLGLERSNLYRKMKALGIAPKE